MNKEELTIAVEILNAKIYVLLDILNEKGLDINEADLDDRTRRKIDSLNLELKEKEKYHNNIFY